MTPAEKIVGVWLRRNRPEANFDAFTTQAGICITLIRRGDYGRGSVIGQGTVVLPPGDPMLADHVRFSNLAKDINEQLERLFSPDESWRLHADYV